MGQNSIFIDVFQDYPAILKWGGVKRLYAALKFLIVSKKVEKFAFWVRLELRAYKSKKLFSRIIGRHCQNHILINYSSTISPIAKIGEGLYVPHPIGIVIGNGVIIGKNATIYQNVTFGRKNKSNNSYPVVGDDCCFYANSTILGNIEVKNNTTVGAYSMLLSSTNIGSTYVGVPAHEISKKENNLLERSLCHYLKTNV